MNAPPATIDSALASLLTGLPRGAVRPVPTHVADDAPFLRTTVGPLALMLTTPLLSVLFWIACAHHDGNVVAMVTAGPAAWWAELPAPSWTAAGIFAGWVALQAGLLRLLPGKPFEGPITPAGVRPHYVLNGVAAWVVTHALLVGAWWAGLYRADTLYEEYGSLLTLLALGALVFCGFLVWKGRTYPSSPDAVLTGNPVLDFWQGVELHPRMFGMSLKQLINCRVSMMGWSAVFVVFLLAQVERHGLASTSMIASTTVLVVYLFKFFWWEGGYFHSLDIMHDRFGYYIGWGVLAWVPAVYCLPALWLVDHPIQWHPAVAGLMVAVGLAAIWVNYDADAQRQRVRATNGDTLVWGKRPELLRAEYTTADGKRHESLLLLSGWWGVARHFHYVPELTLAAAWCAPSGFTHFLPWFYFFFLAILLTDRARRDERRCAAKYGHFWEQYRRRVPWRMVPGLY